MIYVNTLRLGVKATLAGVFVTLANHVAALDRGTPFGSIEGSSLLTLSRWEWKPILMVNTASIFAFNDQYRELQALYDRFRDDGLVVLAVPSDDFNQEFASDQEVKDFCELVYGIDMPMTVTTGVKGRNAHLF